MPRKFKSAEAKRAYDEHQKWLAKRGLRTKPKSKSQLRGIAVRPDPAYRSPELPELRHVVPGEIARPAQDLRDQSLREAIQAKAATVAPSFNKGPLQPQTSTDFTSSRRRD